MQIFLPKISIIVPTLNQGSFIEETLRSVINQPYAAKELIVADGGSTDNTPAIIRKYESNIRFWVSEEDRGQSDAINKGFVHCKGDVVTWLNSDDHYEENVLQIVADVFSSGSHFDVLHGRARFYGRGRRDRVVGPERELAPADYLAYMRFPQPASFFRRRVFEECGPLDTQLHFAMDYELCAKAVLKGFIFKGVPGVLANYRMHEASKSRMEARFLEEWSQVFRNVLASVREGEPYLLELGQLGITSGEPSTYQSVIHPPLAAIESAFLGHLHLHFHTRYRLGEMDWCVRIASFLKEKYPEWYRSKEYGRYVNRLRFTPAFLFNLVQRLKN